MKIVWEKCVVTNLIDLQKFVEVTSTNAAKIFNMYPKKGKIAVGSDADIVIWNNQVNQVISSKGNSQACDYNIFEGTKISGAPEYVIVKGKVCYEEDKVRVAQGFGQCVTLPSNCPYIYGAKNGVDHEDFVDALDQFQVDFEDRDYVPERADSIRSSSTQATHTARAPRPGGQRDMQTSTFSISKGKLFYLFLKTNY